MNRADSRHRPHVAAMLAVLLVTSACATGSGAMKRADTYSRLGEWDTAITYLQQVLSEHPEDREARAKLDYAKANASVFHRAEGKKLFDAQDLQRAQLETELAVRLDPTNELARVQLRHINEALDEQRRMADAERTPIEMAMDASRLAPPAVPELVHTAMGTMTFDYRRAKIREIYRSIARLGNINVLLDPDLDNENTSFYLSDVTYEKAWEILTATQGHFYRVLTPNTIVVAPDNQQKRRQYEPQVLRTFYLSNAEAEGVATTLQTILGARQVAPSAEINAVTIRDTADVVDVAAHLIRGLDKAKGEVLLQIEIFEVDRGTMDEWGLSLSDYATSVSLSQGETGISFSDLGNVTNQDVFITVPSLRYQFLKQNTNFRLIAQPQLRASDGQVSSLLVGEQRPVVNTTFNPQVSNGGSVIPIATTEYRDVGIIIEAQPRVHHDGQITLQLGIQVTSVQENAGALNQPIFTARNLTTTLRLMEGETNLLAGLLRDDERVVLNGIPILSQIPLLKELFTSTQKEVQQTDIVMSITPYVVRMADITEEDLAPIFVGTEANISGGAGGSRRGNRGGGGQDEETAEPELPRDPIQVMITPAEQSASVGQRVSVDVTTSGDAEINNAGMRVSFNPSVLRFVDATEGSLLGGDGAATSFQTGATAGGSVAFGIGRVGNVGGVYANGVIASLQFEVVGAGDSPIQIISAALRDAQGRPLPVEFSPASVTARE